MHRALDAIGAELSDATDDNVRTLVEGIELTERELAKVLEKHGVKMFTPQGEKFDPNVHQAMYEVADGSAAPGTVAQVIQAGFMPVVALGFAVAPVAGQNFGARKAHRVRATFRSVR